MTYSVGDKVEWHSASHEGDDCQGTIIQVKENSVIIYWWRSGGTYEYWNRYIEGSMTVVNSG